MTVSLVVGLLMVVVSSNPQKNQGSYDTCRFLAAKAKIGQI
jgi:hypothetical protein